MRHDYMELLSQQRVRILQVSVFCRAGYASRWILEVQLAGRILAGFHALHDVIAPRKTVE